MLGVTLNDIDTGVYTARLDPHRIVRAAQNEVVIRYHRYPRVTLSDFVLSLARTVKAKHETFPAPVTAPEVTAFPVPNRPMTIARLIERLDRALTPDMIVVSDVGDCLFAAIDLRVYERSEFLSSAFYTTMGFAVPAALGAQIARPDHRALILVGDGAFQMTGTELSTHIRFGLVPIVVVFNNCGYSTERYILDGPFNDIACWRFDRLGELFGPLNGYDAPDEESFEKALVEALANHATLSIINVHISRDDSSSAMRRLAEVLKSRVRG